MKTSGWLFYVVKIEKSYRPIDGMKEQHYTLFYISPRIDERLLIFKVKVRQDYERKNGMRKSRAFHFLYLLLLFITVVVIFILQGIYLNKDTSQEAKHIINIICNILYSGIASIIVAWIIDIRTTRQNNQDNKQLAQTVLLPLQTSLAFLLEDFAYIAYRLSANTEQKNDDKNAKRTWIEWMQLWEDRDERVATTETIESVKTWLLRGLERVRIECDALQNNQAFLLKCKVLQKQVFTTFREIREEIDAFYLEVDRSTDLTNIIRYEKPVREDLVRYFSELPQLSWMNEMPYALYGFVDLYTQHEMCTNHPVLYRISQLLKTN